MTQVDVNDATPTVHAAEGKRRGYRSALAALALMAACLFGFAVFDEPGQWSWSTKAAQLTSPAEPPGPNWLLIVDFLFAAWYVAVALLFLLATLSKAEEINDIDPARYGSFARRVARWSLTGFVYVAVAGLADWAENASTLLANGRKLNAGAGVLVAATAAAWVKWLALAAGATALLVTAVAAVVRRHDLKSLTPDERVPPWKGGRNRHPAVFDVDPQEKRTGVSLSGGGIRSAAFSLGALQAIADSRLAPIKYVTSVSGGGYMAAAWASLSREGSTPPFLRRSPEERWVRHHTDYLVSNGGVVLGAAAALLGGFAVNLLFVFLAFQVVAHPAGWVLGAAHPELTAREPIVNIVRQPDAAVGTPEIVSRAVAVNAEGERSRPIVSAYTVPLTLSGTLVTTAATVDAEAKHPLTPALKVRPALIVESKDGLKVARQPLLTIGDTELLSVARQPRLSVEGGPGEATVAADGSMLEPEDVKAFVKVEAPLLRQRSGTLGRSDMAAPTWLWMSLASIGLLSVVLWAIDRRLLRRESDPDNERSTASDLLAGSNVVAAGVAKLLAFAVAAFLILPWLAVNLPKSIGNLPGYDTVATGWRAVGAFLAAAGTILWRLRGTIKLPGLKRFRGRGYIIDGALGLVVVALLATTFVAFVDVALANGPNGRLEGVYERWLPGAPDWARWAVALGLLTAMLLVQVPSHAWSLYTFYRSRLGEAYMLQRIPEAGDTYRVAPVRGRAVHEWQWAAADDEAGGDAGPSLAMPQGGARLGDVGAIQEWVVCTTVNIRGSGEAAPGRGAGSFSFSKSWVGGPEVGWMKTSQYLENLDDARCRDVSVPSSVTISGAAFSPAMGKMSKPWQGRLFALANLRLGVWVPNPMAISHGREFNKRRSPNAAWYLRELIGWFDRTAPYVYLTDGGHWENLGLVELLRRGCTDIWMVSAAGDGISSFETLAQAFALAREEVGVNFTDLDLEKLRPQAADADSRRRLLRDDGQAGTAASSFVRGKFFYGDQTEGRITVIEAALLGDLPWDVHSYAERNGDFPDLSTGYQLMDHRDFEAYRMLGFTQTTRALASDDLVPMRGSRGELESSDTES